ncbi:MAG: UDP-N-acetylmuramoylalanine--D-glutamate ligase [Treponematales bacterium]
MEKPAPGEKIVFAGMKALVMGLGLNGGGLGAAKFLALHGAEVTVTDLRDEAALAPSIEALETAVGGKAAFPVRYALGRHETWDFECADMVIKNPGVRPDSPYLKAARRVETDISLFLRLSPARLLAVTGTKGKSGTASALRWALDKAAGTTGRRAYLGGNIAVSPLSFVDELRAGDDVVLELSSWQLGDLRGSGLLKPRAAVLTAIMPDHLDRYGTMEAYIADKRLIYREQDEGDAIIACGDEWGRSFLEESRGRPLVCAESPLPEGVSGGWLTGTGGPCVARFCGGEPVEVVPAKPLVPGEHQKKNLLAAGLALLDLGLPPALAREALGSFPGIEHRLEFFWESGGVRFYNDSGATIPQAAAAAARAFGKPPILVAGGTDKNLDFRSLAAAAKEAKAVALLEGSGSDKLKALLAAGGVPFLGPFGSAEAAARAAIEAAAPGDVVVFSPGCTSFGMFLNEFDRGRKWKEAVRAATGERG